MTRYYSLLPDPRPLVANMAATDIITPVTQVPTLIQRNTLRLAAAQCVGWVMTQTLATLGGIIASDMTSDRRWAGIPVTLSILASALTGPYAGRMMDRVGRKPVLLAGQVALGLGSLLVAASIGYGIFPGYLAGIAILGVGAGATALSRSAAADMYPPSRRAQGISMVAMGGAVGAILGPFLLAAIVSWSKGAGADPNVTAWLVIPILAIIAFFALLTIRPDPRDIAANLADYYPSEGALGTKDEGRKTNSVRALSAILKQYPVIVAIAATALVQAGMVMLMVTVALSMKDHGHGDDVFEVMSVHFFGMLGLALLIGRVADRLGRRPVIIMGALIFIAGAVSAPMFENPLYNGASLFLVGLGWSLCYVAGNAILADMAGPMERGRTLGANDLLVGLTGATASLVGGLLISGAGFLTVGAVGLALGLVPLLLALRLREPQPGQYEF
ncbi:MAG TPA: MFS transporter [Chloroflexia bacterium]|nr:MFS transporter [Chloroflexia bacterium]